LPHFFDRVKETTTTTGTGTITLAGAVAQFVSFQSVFTTGARVYYAIVGQSGNEWEVGYGTLATTTTLSRDVVLASSNAGALVNFSAGAKDVFNTLAAQSANAASLGRNVAVARGCALP
jgi:hypothetical protein